MRLLSKYIAEKQLRRTEQLLYIIQKVVASVRENHLLQSARARRTSNKPNNTKAMKKICMPFCTVTSSEVVCDTEIGPYMHLPSRDTDFMSLPWALTISHYKSDSSWETLWGKVCLCCWSCSHYWATTCWLFWGFYSSARKESVVQNLALGSESDCITPSPGNEPGAQQWDKWVTFATAGSGNLRNCSFIKHIRDSALFAYWYPWRKGIQRWGCECYLLYHHFQAARTVLFAL